MKNDNLLSISVIVNFYNEESNLRRLLPSLKKQNYPRDKIEYIFIDDSSTDSSLHLAKKFGGTIIKVNTHDIELNKGIGMHAAKKEVICWLDADMELCDENFFAELLRPIAEDPKVIGSFTKEFALEGSTKPKSSILRFISYDIFQRDPVFKFFSNALEKSFLNQVGKYYLCRFVPKKTPPVGRITYRRKELLKIVGKDKSFIDMESMELMVRAGYQLFAFAPKARMRHYHAETLSELIRKRLRNMEKDYLPNINNKHFTWIQINNPFEIQRILFWIIYANLFIPELCRGLLLSYYHRDWVFLYQPVISIAVTDSIIWSLLTKEPGRRFVFKLIYQSLSKLISRFLYIFI